MSSIVIFIAKYLQDFFSTKLRIGRLIFIYFLLFSLYSQVFICSALKIAPLSVLVSTMVSSTCSLQKAYTLFSLH